jgi:lipopolysaccharide/colanic/teichoic acid biosynthesis glycosyltransferase
MFTQIPSAQSMQTIQLRPGYVRMKRIIDIVFTLLIIPLLLVVGVIMAILIRLDSPGPTFFRQKRIGQNGKEFEMLKFRSMYVNADSRTHQESIEKYMRGEKLHADATNKLSYKKVNDPRITKIGRVIRKLSIDELPQFWNVLTGDMALVGPRPPLQYEVELYNSSDWLRLSGKPGLTGPWQVYGRSRVTFAEMVEMDINYLQKSSLWYDLKLIVLTLPVMIFARGGA